MQPIEILKDYWAVLGGFIALIVWLVRLEAGMKANGKEILSLWRQRNEDLEAARSSRIETNEILGRLDKKMEAAFTELRGDIKELLRQDRR